VFYVGVRLTSCNGELIKKPTGRPVLINYVAFWIFKRIQTD
jgi:hypothetical protein